VNFLARKGQRTHPSRHFLKSQAAGSIKPAGGRAGFTKPLRGSWEKALFLRIDGCKKVGPKRQFDGRQFDLMFRVIRVSTSHPGGEEPPGSLGKIKGGPKPPFGAHPPENLELNVLRLLRGVKALHDFFSFHVQLPFDRGRKDEGLIRNKETMSRIY